LQQAARTFGVEVSDGDARRFGASVPDWPPLDDAAPFLRRLRTLGKPTAILSNVTREAIRPSVHKLDVPFDLVVTADDVRSYKPAPPHWLRAQTDLGVEPSEQLHIAASMTHDIRPCALMGVPVVWVNRHDEATPAGVEPSLVVKDLSELGDALGLPPDPDADRQLSS
jgi:2-haloalkanoic acid dehalogenase type II